LNNECIYIDRCDNKSYSSSPTSRRCIKDYVSDYILCVSVSWLLPLKEEYQGLCIRLYLVCFSLIAPPPQGGVSKTMYQTISCVFQSHGSSPSSSPSRRSIKDYVSDYVFDESWVNEVKTMVSYLVSQPNHTSYVW